ncbi:MAG: hypothetical protein LBC26_06750 [Oscillospiraceae bacterium]|jgi:phosphopantothenate-cysteine ligase|nr:hypothetical protein [Oscillospiraceae bacterium]
MTVLITAGGTVEPIDNVRGVTNFATGRLGSLVADRVAADGHRVLYVHGKNAALPENPSVTAYEIGSVRDLSDKIRALCGQETLHLIVHSMAVSDYTVEKVTDANGELLSGGKIGSSHEKILVHLRQTPKVIAEFQRLAPRAALIGCKLLSGVPKAELIARAQELLRKHQCAYVLANLAEDISKDRHMGYLVDETGVVQTYRTKREIAEGVARLCQTISCSASPGASRPIRRRNWPTG